MIKTAGLSLALVFLLAGPAAFTEEPPPLVPKDFPDNPAPPGALVFDFDDVKQLNMHPILAAKGCSLKIIPDGKYGKNMVELTYNFSTPEKVIGEAFFNVPNYTYQKNFSGYATLTFWVKGDASAAYLRDRVKLAVFSNISGGKWVHFQAKVNEMQEALPDLFIEAPGWKKISLDLDRGPFHDWNNKHPEFARIFTYRHDDFPWDKVFSLYVGVEKYDSGPHQGKICFSRFIFMPREAR